MFPQNVRLPGRDTCVLKSGGNNRKIGAVIRKGKWKTFPTYTLTLEERATCPISCRHWRSCYGNGMNLPMAIRWWHGAELERHLKREVAALAREHPNGFAVRLHTLGDFYSVGYVELWRSLLERNSALHVWGYTARWEVETDPIAAALVSLVKRHWDRCAIRFSNATIGVPATITIETPLQKPPDAIVCPEHVGRTESCSTCALCWQSKRRIAFNQH
jgi:hypothetical protein